MIDIHIMTVQELYDFAVKHECAQGTLWAPVGTNVWGSIASAEYTLSSTRGERTILNFDEGSRHIMTVKELYDFTKAFGHENSTLYAPAGRDEYGIKLRGSVARAHFTVFSDKKEEPVQIYLSFNSGDTEMLI